MWHIAEQSAEKSVKSADSVKIRFTEQQNSVYLSLLTQKTPRCSRRIFSPSRIRITPPQISALERHFAPKRLPIFTPAAERGVPVGIFGFAFIDDRIQITIRDVLIAVQNRVQTGVAMVSLVLCNVQRFLHALDSGEEAEDAGGDQEDTE